MPASCNWTTWVVALFLSLDGGICIHTTAMDSINQISCGTTVACHILLCAFTMHIFDMNNSYSIIPTSTWCHLLPDLPFMVSIHIVCMYVCTYDGSPARRAIPSRLEEARFSFRWPRQGDQRQGSVLSLRGNVECVPQSDQMGLSSPMIQ